MAILGLIRRIMGASNDVGLCYNAMVAQARQPHFYAQLGVPDTFDGRFECIVLHLAILHAAMAEPVERHAQRQALVEHFVSDMDNQMREIGVSDSGHQQKNDQDGRTPLRAFQKLSVQHRDGGCNDAGGKPIGFFVDIHARAC